MPEIENPGSLRDVAQAISRLSSTIDLVGRLKLLVSNQPRISAGILTAQTNMANDTVIVFDDEFVDNANIYNNTTGVITFDTDTAGVWILGATVRIDDNDQAATRSGIALDINVGGTIFRGHTFNPSLDFSADFNDHTHIFSPIIHAFANGDTARFRYLRAGGANQADTVAGSSSLRLGYLTAYKLG